MKKSENNSFKIQGFIINIVFGISAIFGLLSYPFPAINDLIVKCVSFKGVFILFLVIFFFAL